MYQENSQPVRQSTPLDYQMGPPIETMEQINDKLITASRGGGVITIPTPNLKEKTFFVLVKDEVGNHPHSERGRLCFQLHHCARQ